MGITTRMARTFLRWVPDLVGSCREAVIDHRCCCSALMNWAVRHHVWKCVQVREGAWPRLLPQLPQQDPPPYGRPLATVRWQMDLPGRTPPGERGQPGRNGGTTSGPPARTPPNPLGSGTPDRGGGLPGSGWHPRPDHPLRGCEGAGVYGQAERDHWWPPA